MKRQYFLIIAMLFLFSGLSQSGKVMDQLTLDSKILKGERKFAVYLPPDYESPQEVILFYICFMVIQMIKLDGFSLVKSIILQIML